MVNNYIPSYKGIFTLMANNVLPQVYKKLRCDFRSPLTKTPDWSVEMFGRSRNIGGGGGEIFNMCAFGVCLRYENLSNIMLGISNSLFDILL